MGGQAYIYCNSYKSGETSWKTDNRPNCSGDKFLLTHTHTSDNINYLANRLIQVLWVFPEVINMTGGGWKHAGKGKDL